MLFSANALVICTVDVQSLMLERNLSSFFTETDIRDFVGLYRQLCPGESIFPKMHYLEEHLIQFMRRWHVGPGMMGEHGGESIHHIFNRLGERYSSIPRNSTRLLHTLRQHLLSVNPDLPAAPQAQKRKAPAH